MHGRLLCTFLAVACFTGTAGSARAAELPLVGGVEFQPFASATKRLVEALEYIGAPVSEEDAAVIAEAVASAEHAPATRAIQEALDRYCVLGVDISPESRVKVSEGPATKQLVEHGWRAFLVKVHNQAGVTAEPVADSPNAAALFTSPSFQAEPEVTVSPGDVINRFLEIDMYGDRPLKETLSGLSLEYRVIQLYSNTAGLREATLSFNIGQGTQDIGFRNEVAVLFDCLPAVDVTLGVHDTDGAPVMASFVIRDDLGRVYPHPGRRLAPDFFFHSQVYRADGESIRLPPGDYTVEYGRGPEYLVGKRDISVPEERTHREDFQLERWIHLAAEGWRSGDHHVHAAGCSHYESPTQGVTPEDMMRHILGEDLNVGCVLSWGPCWYHQKQFFDGDVHELSTDDYVMRYDVEVSGFPSSHAGHLSLLQLTEDDYPGAERIWDWPSWDLPVLLWAKEQNAVLGFSHSGWGLQVDGDHLPNYNMPKFDGIGANEYIVDVVHDAVDFISTVDTPAVWELNIWYHTLNCGFRTRISGETDFPCIYGERVGLGRSYVKSPAGPVDYANWAEGIRVGRSYVSDGMTHLMDLTVGGVSPGEPGTDGVNSQLGLDGAQQVGVTARVASRIDEEPNVEIANRPLTNQPYWHGERARIGDRRRVPVQLIVNGQVVATQEIEADGSIQEIQFTANIERSSWVALRVFPSAHTNPVFVVVGDKPIRASRRSAEWCLEAVDVCWESKVGNYFEEERAAARAAYDVATDTYRAILAESEVE
ncbi:CehA/McbA family metallohydrolase [Candidatus Poribacteria bacterium]|jgi:hypothetical protein|nr:CehA/McbA family metallohydrolase [Candidatus Poribacteria bacterium]MBT5531830.1 CehA/McbA family metallohydrolase [Candidatus Poribacteria bacterium]MBT7804649.1 CehA/McbA family metallohydrolase [Candidatus Poribacteria bacterium]